MGPHCFTIFQAVHIYPTALDMLSLSWDAMLGLGVPLAYFKIYIT